MPEGQGGNLPLTDLQTGKGRVPSGPKEAPLCGALGAVSLSNNRTGTPGPEERFLDPFVCPLTGEMFTDPIVASDGYSYEKRAFEKWLADGKRTSPRTGLYLLVTSTMPNHALRKAVELYGSRTRGGPEQGSCNSSRGSSIRGGVEQGEEFELDGRGLCEEVCNTPTGRTAVELAETTLRESPFPPPIIKATGALTPASSTDANGGTL